MCYSLVQNPSTSTFKRALSTRLEQINNFLCMYQEWVYKTHTRLRKIAFMNMKENNEVKTNVFVNFIHSNRINDCILLLLYKIKSRKVMFIQKIGVLQFSTECVPERENDTDYYFLISQSLTHRICYARKVCLPWHNYYVKEKLNYCQLFIAF